MSNLPTKSIMNDPYPARMVWQAARHLGGHLRETAANDGWRWLVTFATWGFALGMGIMYYFGVC